VAPAVRVFAADQSEVVRSFPAIGDSVRELAYVGDLRYGNTIEGRAEILRRLKALGFTATALPGGVYGAGDLYWLTR
jgi:hypothetical protein